MKSGVELIAEERARQEAEEGYNAEHDDSHTAGELAGAGMCYALWYCGYIGHFAWRLAMAFWPWRQQDWKPSQGKDYGDNAIRDLSKAGALLAAEIDRLQRKKENKPRIITGN